MSSTLRGLSSQSRECAVSTNSLFFLRRLSGGFWVVQTSYRLSGGFLGGSDWVYSTTPLQHFISLSPTIYGIYPFPNRYRLSRPNGRLFISMSQPLDGGQRLVKQKQNVFPSRCLRFLTHVSTYVRRRACSVKPRTVGRAAAPPRDTATPPSLPRLDEDRER